MMPKSIDMEGIIASMLRCTISINITFLKEGEKFFDICFTICVSHNHTWCGNSVPQYYRRMAITTTSPILKQTEGEVPQWALLGGKIPNLFLS